MSGSDREKRGLGGYFGHGVELLGLRHGCFPERRLEPSEPRPMRRLIHRIWHGNRGLAAVEFAIVAPVLLLMLGGLVDFSLAFLSKSQLASSVAVGAEYAFIVGPSVSPAAIKNI